MPYRSKTKKKVFSKKIKTPFKRKIGGTGKQNVMPRTMVSLGQGFPKQMLMTHKYIQTDYLTTSSGVTDSQTYSCNGMYDPDISGAGHQPMYFDQMSLLYHHYTVIGSKINIKLSPFVAGDGATSTAMVPCNYTVHIHPSATPTITDPIQIAEQMQVKLKMIPAGLNTVIPINLKWSAKKTFGGSILGNDELKGTPTANPVEQSYYTVSIRPIDLVTTVSYFIQVEIEYIAIWRELKNVAQS